MHVKYLTDLDVAQGYTQYIHNEEIITNLSNIHDFTQSSISMCSDCVYGFHAGIVYCLMLNPRAIT